MNTNTYIVALVLFLAGATAGTNDVLDKGRFNNVILKELSNTEKSLLENPEIQGKIGLPSLIDVIIAFIHTKISGVISDHGGHQHVGSINSTCSLSPSVSVHLYAYVNVSGIESTVFNITSAPGGFKLTFYCPSLKFHIISLELILTVHGIPFCFEISGGTITLTGTTTIVKLVLSGLTLAVDTVDTILGSALSALTCSFGGVDASHGMNVFLTSNLPEILFNVIGILDSIVKSLLSLIF